MITSNVIHRVFFIATETGTGTAFALKIQGREYLVTADHVWQNARRSGRISIRSNDEWWTVGARQAAEFEEGVDLAVLELEEDLGVPDYPCEGSSTGLAFGQRTYFLGFPYGSVGSVAFGRKGYPLPWVKMGVVSQLAGGEFFLDGHNNPGFSGGPVVFQAEESGPFKIAGVVSSYAASQEPVFVHKDWEDEEGRAGQEEADLPTYYTMENMGIVRCFSVDRVLEAFT